MEILSLTRVSPYIYQPCENRQRNGNLCFIVVHGTFFHPISLKPRVYTTKLQVTRGIFHGVPRESKIQEEIYLCLKLMLTMNWTVHYEQTLKSTTSKWCVYVQIHDANIERSLSLKGYQSNVNWHLTPLELLC